MIGDRFPVAAYAQSLPTAERDHFASAVLTNRDPIRFATNYAQRGRRRPRYA